MMHDRSIQHARGALDLRALPVFAPDPNLWTRVVAQQRRRVRAQRWRQGGFALAASAALCAALIGLPRPQPSAPPEMAAGQRESQVLESEWRHVAATLPPHAARLMRVRAIDAALQSAYDSGATEKELAPLWQERNQALRGLIAQNPEANPSDAAAVTRI